ncbi:MAG TPA: kelch repeat-containing protein [Acidimicrobiia bacterium]
MPTGLLDSGYAVLGDFLYLAGGKTSPTGRVTTFLRYDMVNNTWDTLESIPGMPREDPALVAHDGLIYIFGGATTEFNSGDTVTAAVYDPGTDDWDDAGITDLPAGRTAAAAVSWKGEIWILGGFDVDSNALNTVLIYDPADEGVVDPYSSGPALPAARDNASVAIQDDAADTRLYVMGGRAGATTHSTVWMLDITDDGWSPRSSMPTARRSFVAATVDGKIQVFGGENESGVVATVDEYDPVDNSWTTLTGHDWPNPRHGPSGGQALVGVDMTVFLMGGDTQSGANNVTPANDSFTRAQVP